MMAIGSRLLHKPLADAGLIPANCRLMEVVISATGAIVVRYETFISAEDLGKLGVVLQTASEDELSQQKASAEARVSTEP